MEGIKGGGRVGVGVGVDVNGDDLADGMQFCSNHRNNNSNNHGGICAFCLQEKLGKLVSSSFPLPLRASPSSSSSSHSFRSDTASNGVAAAAYGGDKREDGKEYHARRTRMPFVLAKKKKKNDHDRRGDGVMLKRSKSSAIPRGSASKFWSFLYLSSKKQACEVGSIPEPETAAGGVSDDGNRKVSRSRSVGCGSRSFSGDFFERISTGFGDCALRRVESQREGRPKASSSCSSSSMKERVKCGGIFGGFMILTPSSSSSSSSSYWVSSSATEDHINGKPTTTGHGGRSKSWGWTLTSPMRAFTKPSSSNKNNTTTTPNLSAIPSLLAIMN
ncbi:hypothetical protein F3Y22_tig00110600pilonHSYRG00039 [Hibiscus syriacus]|uniref:Uncharacterized protein n=1 Tax=Hibiscus syriacus TaxID=106335 RepID=A0A6A3A3K4_HIBSY|nr:uncharacterized protein LOC120134890 [Hibiscus syriacus]KAE8698237.1 hypothetical protein F3Y22_tig00110600pilonHSYRG00039 [Hibiscus syriacus]